MRRNAARRKRGREFRKIAACGADVQLLLPQIRAVRELVQRLPLESFHVNHTGSGDRQFPPHMMLALLIYCYAHGIFSSRKIERATYRDVAVRYLSANTHPDHDTICTFRRKNRPAFQAAFVNVLELAAELKLLKLGNISLDGTHIKANASIDKNVTYQRACEVRPENSAEQCNLTDKDARIMRKNSDLQIRILPTKGE